MRKQRERENKRKWEKNNEVDTTFCTMRACVCVLAGWRDKWSECGAEIKGLMDFKLG